MKKSSEASKDAARPKPKYLMTYLCHVCRVDFAVADTQDPVCFYCEKKTEYSLIKKQKLSPKVMADRLKYVTDRMMQALQGAYSKMPKDSTDETEGKLLNIMSKAKKLKEDVVALPLTLTPKRSKKRVSTKKVK